MTKVRVAGFSISLDGFGAGPEQCLENPLGKRGHELHTWLFGTRMFRTMVGKEAVRTASIRPTHIVRWTGSARSSSAAICLGRSAVRGRTRAGKAGGATTRLIIRRPRADAPSTRSDRDGRWHHLHLRDQRYRGGVGSGETISQWARREDRRWRRDGASLSSRRAIDGAAFRLVPGRARARLSVFAGIDLPALGYRVTEHRATEHATHLVLGR